MGTEPVESEMPPTLSDFPELVQLTFNLYSLMRDQWDSMGGSYLGKDLGSIFEFFRLFKFELDSEQLLAISFMQQMDAIRAKLVSEKLTRERKASSNKKA